jgi:hypothetical protein
LAYICKHPKKQELFRTSKEKLDMSNIEHTATNEQGSGVNLVSGCISYGASEVYAVVFSCPISLQKCDLKVLKVL